MAVRIFSLNFHSTMIVFTRANFIFLSTVFNSTASTVMVLLFLLNAFDVNLLKERALYRCAATP